MPLYEYECVPNHHRFEVRQSINDEPVKICPECGEPVRRVIQPVGIVFKGSGFYVTDSRTSSNPASKPAAETPKTEGESSAAPPAAPTKTESGGESKAAS